MKKIYSILFFLFLLNSCGEYSNPFNDPNQTKQVKTQTKVLVDTQSDAELSIVYEKHYNQNGDLVTLIVFDSNSKKKSESNFEYEGSTKTEEVVEFNSNGDTTAFYNKKYKENSSGQIYEIEKFDKNGELQEKSNIFYDEIGNISEEKIEKKNGLNESKSYDYNYSNNGELSSVFVKDNTSGDILKKDSLIYSNQKIELISYDNTGKISHSQQTHYDENGLILKEIKKDNSGKIIEKYIYKYKYY